MNSRGADANYRYATIQGQVRFVLDNIVRTEYTGSMDLALSYRKDSSEVDTIRGALDAIFPRQGPDGRVNENVRMLAAIESRPQ